MQRYRANRLPIKGLRNTLQRRAASRGVPKIQPRRLFSYRHGKHISTVQAVERLYRIGEVARLLGEQPHTLRHWERQFGQPRPRRGATGERLYSQQDVEILRRIQHVLRTERLTLPQARQRLGRLSHEPTWRATLELLRELLLLLLALLPEPPEQLSGE